MNPMTAILGRSQPREKYNILCAPTHERYETGLAMTGHNFYAVRADGIKDWNTTYAPLPSNYTLLDKSLVAAQLPTHIHFDFALSQNKFGQYQILKQLADRLHIPLISLEHTLPMPGWPPEVIQDLKRYNGDINVFISSFSINQWGYNDRHPSVCVVHHMVDTDVFVPGNNTRTPHILSVVNDWVNRDVFCNFKGWQRITQGLPVRVVGDTPGLSKPAASVPELVSEYGNSLIFLNTSTVSPIPTALLEAMACGCAVVSTATCMIPEIIENGVNGFISNDEGELRKIIVDLLQNPQKCAELGYNARQTIQNSFSKSKFLDSWNRVFNIAANLPYIGG